MTKNVITPGKSLRERKDRKAQGDETKAAPRNRRRKDARPAEIVAAGLAEFAEHGFAGATLDGVAKRAGVAKGTIYLYFRDKEALFMAAVRSRVAPFFDEVVGFVDVYPGTSADLLTTLFTILHQQMVNSDLRVLMRMIIAEGRTFPELTEFYYRESVSKGRAVIERIVARGIERGEFRRGAVADLPMVIVAPAIMAAVWKMTFEPQAPIASERFVAAHIDLVLNGLRKREGEG